MRKEKTGQKTTAITLPFK